MENNLVNKIDVFNYWGSEYNKTATAIDTALADIINKKESIIKDKFIEKGFGHLIANLDKRRFKRVVIEKQGDLERYYADDGTDEGVLIVTFKEMTTNSSQSLEGGIVMNTEIKYY